MGHKSDLVREFVWPDEGRGGGAGAGITQIRPSKTAFIAKWLTNSLVGNLWSGLAPDRAYRARPRLPAANIILARRADGMTRRRYAASPLVLGNITSRLSLSKGVLFERRLYDRG